MSGFLLAVAVTGLTACRTSPGVAAYVGDERVTVAELEAAVDERTADEQIADLAAQDEQAYTRQVFSLLLQGREHDVAAERYGVEVTETDVRDRIEALLGGDDPEAVFDQLAQQGIARADVEEDVRQQLIRREIAVSEGLVQEPTDEELQTRYDEAREGLAEVELGYINVPDQAAADALQTTLQADRGQYAAAAEQYAGPYTSEEITQQPLSEVPGPLAEQVAAAEPNTVAAQPVEGVEGLIVTYVGEKVYPTLEEVRPQLEQEFTQSADAAGAELVAEVREDTTVVVNPRFGTLDENGEVVPGGGGVVELLEETAAGEGAGGGTAPE